MDCRHQYVHLEWSGGAKISSETSHQWPFLLCISGPLPQPCCGSHLTHHRSIQPLKSQYLSNHSVLDLASCLTHLLLMLMNIHLFSPYPEAHSWPGFPTQYRIHGWPWTSSLQHTQLPYATALPPYSIGKTPNQIPQPSLTVYPCWSSPTTHRGAVWGPHIIGIALAPCPTDWWKPSSWLSEIFNTLLNPLTSQSAIFNMCEIVFNT